MYYLWDIHAEAREEEYKFYITARTKHEVIEYLEDNEYIYEHNITHIKRVNEVIKIDRY
ncbi:hypothetical protein [Metaclostridioides mangenotii]|uniref:hypothetical protein n=1 Tax=Metaclostridioides mangenotii TaxID=1540 RepID=UPI0004B7A0D7|nr:hypothetical protein [Clostridioides mangenotii]